MVRSRNPASVLAVVPDHSGSPSVGTEKFVEGDRRNEDAPSNADDGEFTAVNRFVGQRAADAECDGSLLDGDGEALRRVSLMDRLLKLCILDSDGQAPLVSLRGVPEKDHLSDHLPLLFQLDV